MPGTVKSELLPDADRLHKCDGQEKVCGIQHLPLDKSHFITDFYWQHNGNKKSDSLYYLNNGNNADNLS